MSTHLPPPWGQTDTYENITLPQLRLRVVKCLKPGHTNTGIIGILNEQLSLNNGRTRIRLVIQYFNFVSVHKIKCEISEL